MHPQFCSHLGKIEKKWIIPSLEGKGINIKDNFSIFTRLGLTIRQAQVYLANAQLGQATVKPITKRVQADRTEIYRSLIKLEELGLAQRYIANPITFKAAPITEAFSILLEQNAEKQKEIEKQANQFLRIFNNHNVAKPNGEDTQYRLTSGVKVEKRQLSKDITKIQMSSDIMLIWKPLLRLFNTHFEQVNKALERGVKIRCITNIPENRDTPQIIQVLNKRGALEIKSTSMTPKAGIDIHDKKSVHIITFSNDLNEIEVLRSQNPALVELLQDYFILKWQTATTPRWHKKRPS